MYRYASRFVAVCRARIAKVSVEVDEMRGQVMLNGDFEGFDLKEGILVRILKMSTGKDVKVCSVKDDVESIQWQGPQDEIPKLWQPSLNSALALFKMCMRLDRKNEENEGDETAICVPGVGWCNVRGKKIQMLFEDGVRMEVNLETKEIVYCDLRRRKEWWKLDQEDLPRYVLERLEQCEVFRDVES